MYLVQNRRRGCGDKNGPSIIAFLDSCISSGILSRYGKVVKFSGAFGERHYCLEELLVPDAPAHTP
jgi:hypothetical protein